MPGALQKLQPYLAWKLLRLEEESSPLASRFLIPPCRVVQCVNYFDLSPLSVFGCLPFSSAILPVSARTPAQLSVPCPQLLVRDFLVQLYWEVILFPQNAPIVGPAWWRSG